jgi:hypothetical protein
MAAAASSSLETAAFRTVKRAKDMFVSDHDQPIEEHDKA